MFFSRHTPLQYDFDVPVRLVLQSIFQKHNKNRQYNFQYCAVLQTSFRQVVLPLNVSKERPLRGLSYFLISFEIELVLFCYGFYFSSICHFKLPSLDKEGNESSFSLRKGRLKTRACVILTDSRLKLRGLRFQSLRPINWTPPFIQREELFWFLKKPTSKTTISNTNLIKSVKNFDNICIIILQYFQANTQNIHINN